MADFLKKILPGGSGTTSASYSRIGNLILIYGITDIVSTWINNSGGNLYSKIFEIQLALYARAYSASYV